MELRAGTFAAGPGAALTSRGGPALLSVRTTAPMAESAFQVVSDLLVHDRPLDWIALEAARSYARAEVSLAAGAGREETGHARDVRHAPAQHLGRARPSHDRVEAAR